MKSKIYNQAKYYEIAFSFVDSKKQIKLFENFIKKYSKINVKRVLDIACGTALQLREFAKKNYQTIGLDYSTNMIEYLKNQSKLNNLKIETVRGDMNKFKLKQKVDFAYILMGSFIYTKNNKLLSANLDSVANSLNQGGLYLIENLALNWASPDFFKPQTWTMKEGKTKVKTTYKITSKNALTQVVTQMIKLEVDENGKKMEFIDINDLKLVFPEEIKLLVELNGKFEFVGFFERHSTKQLKKESPDNIIILRKK